MKKSQVWALVLVLLGVIVVLIPWHLFPVCGVGRYAPPAGMLSRMHGCDNTLKAATVLGVLAMCTGILPLLVKQRWAILIAAALAAIFGVLLILFPIAITGVCRIPTMPCVFGTKPALIIAGIVLFLAGGVGGLLIKKTE
jgi:vacuolar-type H+-ATPase subunit I/STV1